MSGNLSGQFAGLAKVIGSLEGLAKDGIADTSIKAAANINDLVEHQFDLGVDPWGRSWAALKPSTTSTGRTPPPLTASGKMRGKAKAIPGVKGITERIPSPAGFHQSGTKKMEARPMVPHGAVLPPSWEEAVSKAGAEVISARLQR